MKKKVLATLMATALAVTTLAGCGNDAPAGTDGTGGSASESTPASTEENNAPAEKEDVTLTVWGGEEDQTLLKEMIDAFVAANADVANWNITVGVESESTAKDTILTDIEAAADVFAFADDQVNELVAAGALQEVLLNTEEVIAACGGEEAGAVQAAMYDGKLYAYPMTADNGYFMFYDKSVFSEEDVQSLDKMLEVAAAAGKKVTMDWSSGWYIYSLFQAAGLEASLADDGVNNICTWNSTDGAYTGVDVAQAMLDIAANPGFINTNDAGFVAGIQDGTIAAGINGVWNATAAEEAWGENYAACKLPSYTLAGSEVQMASFAGYKLIGVNAYSDYAGYAMMLAEYLTNYDNQVLRFESRGQGPANVEAAASDAVQSAPAIAALAEQSQYATTQRIGGNYWDPVATFGAIMADGNPDGTDLQTLLDNMVEGITAPVAQ